MPLSADREVTFFTSQELVDLPVDDNVKIYKGALVGRNRSTGYARPLTAGDDFLGIAYKQADNTITGHTAGGIHVRLCQNVDIVHALASVANADIGKEVYASDDQTLTLTNTSNSRVGRVVAVESSGKARVRCQPAVSLSGVLENDPVILLPDSNSTLTLNHINRTLLIANSTGRTVSLPPAATVRPGGWFRLIKTSAAAAAVTIDPDASETIDGNAALATMDAQYDTVLVLCTGTEWIVLSRDIA